ncbi:MAG: hypothetical protein RJB66_2265 [Pseudomonadota bacterium]|jgi:hypothetical protein
MSDHEAKEKLELWQGRILLVKKARQLVREKHFAEAIVVYEKYLKIFETVFNVSIESLTSQSFKTPALETELSVLIMVYWDLVRLYEANEKYQERADGIAQRLVEWVPTTGIVLKLVKEAEAHKKKARVPAFFKKLARELMLKKMKLPQLPPSETAKKEAAPKEEASHGGHH